MSLESVINALKNGLRTGLKNRMVNSAEWIDEQVLREYSKITKKWECKGKSRYTLANAFALTSWFSGIYNAVFFNYLTTNTAVLIGIANGTDIGRNVAEPLLGRKEETDSTIAEPHLVLYHYKQFADIARFPLLIGGMILMIKSASEFYDYFTNKNPESLNFALYDSSLGYNFFATATSMYIKESNPKLIDKDPAWKQGCEFLKGKIGGLLPNYDYVSANLQISPKTL